MGNWGISSNSSDQEKIKSKMADYLHGLNSVGDIDYKIYDEAFDFSMGLLDEMYELGKKDSEGKTGRKSYNFEELHEDARKRIKGHIFQEYWVKGSRLHLYSFSQTWSNTSLGWGGVSGQAMTTAQTVVFLYELTNTVCVYIGGKFAFLIDPIGKNFWSDVKNHRIKGVADAEKGYENIKIINK